MPAQKKTFRLDEKTLDMLVKYSSKNGISQTEAVQRAIQLLAEMPDRSHTDASPESGDVEWLMGQLEEKDRQIENLQRLLDQEQQLHMATSRTLKALEAPKPGFWKRVFSGE